MSAGRVSTASKWRQPSVRTCAVQLVPTTDRRSTWFFAWNPPGESAPEPRHARQGDKPVSSQRAQAGALLLPLAPRPEALLREGSTSREGGSESSAFARTRVLLSRVSSRKRVGETPARWALRSCPRGCRRRDISLRGARLTTRGARATLGGAVATHAITSGALRTVMSKILANSRTRSRVVRRHLGKIRWRLRAAAIVARAWRFHARGGDAEGRFSDRLAAGGARVSPGAGAQIAALPHALGSSSHIQRLLGFRGGPVGRARERDAAGHARLRRAQRKRAAGYVDDQASAPELEAGHGSAPCRRLARGVHNHRLAVFPVRHQRRRARVEPSLGGARGGARGDVAGGAPRRGVRDVPSVRAQVLPEAAVGAGARGGGGGGRRVRRGVPDSLFVRRRDGTKTRVVSGAAPRAARERRRVRTSNPFARQCSRRTNGNERERKRRVRGTEIGGKCSEIGRGRREMSRARRRYLASSRLGRDVFRSRDDFRRRASRRRSSGRTLPAEPIETVLSAAAEAKIVRECCESAIRGLAKEKWRGRSASASGTAARLARRADVCGARRRRLRRDRVSESGSLRFDSVGCSTPPVGESPFRRARDDEERDESFAWERLARYRRHGRRLPGRVRASAACDSRRRSRKHRDISPRRRRTSRLFRDRTPRRRKRKRRVGGRREPFDRRFRIAARA